MDISETTKQHGDSTTSIDNDGCSICLARIEDRSTISECNHSFCRECIYSWVAFKARVQASCPLCKSQFDSVRCNDDEKEIITVESIRLSRSQHSIESDGSAATAPEEDLMCLDHRYFLDEVTRLIASSDRLHKVIEADRRNQRGRSALDEQRWLDISSISGSLYEYRNSLTELEPFEPSALLQDLYHIQERIETLWQGQSTVPQQQQQQQQRFSAYDAWCFDSNSNDPGDDESSDDDVGDENDDRRRGRRQTTKKPSSKRK